MILRDYMGNPIEVGAKVVYNRSGELRFGIVRELRPSKGRANLHFLNAADLKSMDINVQVEKGVFWIKVEMPYIMVQDLMVDAPPSGKLSRVKDRKSVVVLI